MPGGYYPLWGPAAGEVGTRRQALGSLPFMSCQSCSSAPSFQRRCAVGCMLLTRYMVPTESEPEGINVLLKSAIGYHLPIQGISMRIVLLGAATSVLNAREEAST